MCSAASPLPLGDRRPLGVIHVGRIQRWQRQSFPLKVTHSPAGKAFLRNTETDRGMAGNPWRITGNSTSEHVQRTCKWCTQSKQDGRSSPGPSPRHPPQIPYSCCRACREASGSPAGKGSRRSSQRSRSEPCHSHILHTHTHKYSEQVMTRFDNKNDKNSTFNSSTCTWAFNHPFISNFVLYGIDLVYSKRGMCVSHCQDVML